MSLSTRMFIDFKVIASFVALIAPEVDIIIVLIHELEAERLVPPLREHIE